MRLLDFRTEALALLADKGRHMEGLYLYLIGTPFSLRGDRIVLEPLIKLPAEDLDYAIHRLFETLSLYPVAFDHLGFSYDRRGSYEAPPRLNTIADE